MEEIDWSKTGQQPKKKFIVPVGNLKKKWWQFWKKDPRKSAEESIRRIMRRYNEEIIIHDIDPEAGAGLLKAHESFSKPFDLKSYMKAFNIKNIPKENKK